MSKALDPDFESWVQRARDVPIMDVVSMLGARLKRAGNEHVGPCPLCGGDDRFAVKPSENVFVCRGSGGGDGIAMAMHVRSLEFVAACELILDEPPPRGGHDTPPQPINAEAERERREDQKARKAEHGERVRSQEDRVRQAVIALVERSVPIAGTHGEAYLKGRGIHATAEQLASLRFIQALEYRGYVEGGEAEQLIGEYPCIIAPMVNAAGEIVGVHRTYLDRVKPIKRPRDEVTLAGGKKAENLAKKMFGSKGLIRIGPVMPVMAVAEGIENALSWYGLGYGPDDVCIAAAGDLGWLAGGCTGTVPHPTLRKRVIPNAVPDPARPGMAMPAEVKELILLGDGDSDPANTRAHLLTAARRHRGAGRMVNIHMAPDGADWSDALAALMKERAA